MQPQTIKANSTLLSKVQLVSITIGSIILMYQPNLAAIVALYGGLSMAYSMGSAMVVGHYYSANGIEKISAKDARLLATHFGGMMCNLVMISKAFDYIH